MEWNLDELCVSRIVNKGMPCPTDFQHCHVSTRLLVAVSSVKAPRCEGVKPSVGVKQGGRGDGNVKAY